MKEIHIGKVIEKKLKERKISVVDFAKAIHCNRTNVYSIFRRKSIDIEQLVLISKVLDYDFLSEVYLMSSSNKKYLVLLELGEKELKEVYGKYSVKFLKEV